MAKKESSKKKEQKEQEALMEEQKTVASIIQTVLEQHNMALQPYMQYSQFGIAPQVRLVKVKSDKPNVNKGTDSKPTEATRNEDGDASAE